MISPVYPCNEPWYMGFEFSAIRNSYPFRVSTNSQKYMVLLN